MDAQNSQVIPKNHPTGLEIQDWLVAYLIEEMKKDKVEVDVPFDQYGLESSEAVILTGDLSDWLQYDLDPTLLYDYPTIEALAKHLVEEIKAKI